MFSHDDDGDHDDGVRYDGQLVDDDDDLRTPTSGSGSGSGSGGLISIRARSPSSSPPRPSRCTLVPGPSHVKNIIASELCERFCFYGLRAILVLYLHKDLHLSEPTSNAIYSYFASAAYFSSLIGGYISDSYWGKYRTILVFCCIYLFGSVVLSGTAIDGLKWGAFTGLFFIALGTGGLKPCVAAFGADQLPTNDDKLTTSYWAAFYMSINAGSLGSYILTPLAKKYVGAWFGFGLSSIVLSVSIFAFWLARHKYVNHPPTGSVLGQLFRVIFSACGARRRGVVVDPSASTGSDRHWLDLARTTHSQRSVEDTKAVWRILPVFCVLPIFWSLFDQQGSTWTLQAEKLRLYGLEPEQLGVLNPILVMCLVPVMDKLVYPLLEHLPPRLRLTPLRKMGVGMLFTSASFVLAAVLQARINKAEPNSVSLFWMLPQYITVTVGEVLISITGLEFAYQQAPASMKGCIMALYYCTVAVGDLLAGVLFSVLGHKLSRANLFLLFAALMVLSFFVFVVVAMCYTPRYVAGPLAADDRMVQTPDESQGLAGSRQRHRTQAGHLTHKDSPSAVGV